MNSYYIWILQGGSEDIPHTTCTDARVLRVFPQALWIDACTLYTLYTHIFYIHIYTLYTHI